MVSVLLVCGLFGLCSLYPCFSIFSDVLVVVHVSFVSALWESSSPTTNLCASAGTWNSSTAALELHDLHNFHTFRDFTTFRDFVFEERAVKLHSTWPAARAENE
ncbi:unnamed protein product [Durusdinium trenchii]|uniref:Secreted protein n=1 Tax=Durusdinium trenchii TaxID=1381693 RepID=A0ABP0I585_9DINO